MKPVFFSRSFEDVNLKKGLPQAWHLTREWHAANAITGKKQWPANGSSGRSGEGGGLRREQQARQLHMICVGDSLWAVPGS